MRRPVRVFRILFCKVIPLVAAFFPAGPQADDKRLFLSSFPQSAAKRETSTRLWVLSTSLTITVINSRPLSYKTAWFVVKKPSPIVAGGQHSLGRPFGFCQPKSSAKFIRLRSRVRARYCRKSITIFPGTILAKSGRTRTNATRQSQVSRSEQKDKSLSSRQDNVTKFIEPNFPVEILLGSPFESNWCKNR